MSPKPVTEERYKQSLISHCLVIVLEPENEEDDLSLTEELKTSPSNRVEGFHLFCEFRKQNSECYWNPCLIQAANSLEYRGYLQPFTLLVSSTDLCLEVVRSAWMRRLLRSPKGYLIQKVGDVPPVEMTIVPQTQFAPLADTLCKVVCELNCESITATKDVIVDRIQTNFSEMVVPGEDILHQTLGGLIRDRKLYHAGNGYHIVTPDTYSATSASPIAWERQMLMTNEEAIVRLLTAETKSEKWRNRAIQVEARDVISGDRPGDKVIFPSEDCSIRLERSHSLRLQKERENCKTDACEGLYRFNSLKVSGKRSDSEDGQKRDKVSIFCKLFRRCHSRPSSQSVKYATFATQFPPLEWSDPNYIFLQSQGTQTYEKDLPAVTKVRRRSRHGANRERRSLHIHANNRDCKIHHSPNHQNCNGINSRSYCKPSGPRKSFPTTEIECPNSRQMSPILNNRPIPKRRPSDKLNNSSDSPKYIDKQKQLNITNNELTDCPIKYISSGRLQNGLVETNIKTKDDLSWKYHLLQSSDALYKISPGREKSKSPESENNNALNNHKITPTKDVSVDNSVDFEVSVYPHLTWERQIPGESSIKKPDDWCQTVSGKTSFNRTTARPATLTTVTSITTCLSPGTPKADLGTTKNRQKPP